MTKKSQNGENNKIDSLKKDQKALLLRSVAQYLECSGFSKTLKKLLFEAKIEKDEVGCSSLNLEEMFCKYLETCDHADKNIVGHKEQEVWTDVASMAETTDKKKKRRDKCDNRDTVGTVGPAENYNDSSHIEMITDTWASELDVKPIKKDKNDKNSDFIGQGKESDKVRKEMANGTACESPDKKRKEKKKQKVKLNSESLNGNVESHEEKSKPVLSEKGGETDYVMENTSKAKKKKKNKLSDLDDVEQHGTEKEQLNEESKQVAGAEDSPVFNEIAGTAKDDIKISEHNVTCKENKGSKKRKRSVDEDSIPAEKPKRRMTDNSEVRDEAGQATKINGSMGTEAGGESDGQNGLGFISQENVDLKRNGDKSLQKTTKKQLNGSVEAKKPFQRVNVDEIVFRDERLQDNSYWAKDGAENGYGAKAQEILGQVKGRGFRHEKTKKKRGSYRGGQIDLHSHSIKFDASDDE
ncbi:lisH domain-containing protein C1711.05-like isoform X2 [Tripterygium wilfordii]|nr:lisH domain-containing protein C1711.05-like isoform X2 [Tripterygium wilfordii]